MALGPGIPRTTHTWLKPLYDVLQGKQKAGGPAGLNFGSPTGVMGFYGATGIAQPTGVGMTGSAVLGGVTGATFFDFRTNGGTGTQFFTFTDVVNALKLQGLLAK